MADSGARGAARAHSPARCRPADITGLRWSATITSLIFLIYHPLRPRDRYLIARFLLRRSPLGRAALTAWRAYELASDALAYFDEPETLEELQQAAKEPKTGYDIHHIVEQTAGRRDGFPETWINSPENTVRIPRFKHWEINRWYSKGNEEFDGMSPRNYLRGKTWKERYEVGLKALRDVGVLK